MKHRLTTNYAKNYCNRTLIVKVIVESVVTCFFWDSVYICLRGGQLDELLASMAARCHVYLQLRLYCILSIARMYSDK